MRLGIRLLLWIGLLAALAPAARSAPLDTTPRVAVLSAFDPEWKALRAIVTDGELQTFKGVSFVVGRIDGRPVVVGMTGVSMVNAAMTTQMLLDRYNVTRLVVSGIAGGVDPALNIGDVSVPARWAEYLETIFARETPTGFELPPGTRTDLPNFGMMFPRGVRVFREGQDGAPRQFWFPVDPAMLEVARASTASVALERCTSATVDVCLVHQPRVQVGGQGVSGTAFVDNAAFRSYAYDTYKAQVLDMESAAIAHVAATNGVPFIAFRALSDLAGGGAEPNQIRIFEELAAVNSVRVMRAFLKALPD